MVREHERAKQTSEHRFNPVTRAGLKRWAIAWFRAGLHCIPLALPMQLMVACRNGQHESGQTTDWFNWQAKFAWLTMLLRARWLAFDNASSAEIGLLLYRTFRDPHIEY